MITPYWRSARKWLGGRGCPTEQQLAAYADRQLIGQERHAVEHHLADCRECAEQVTFLARSASLSGSEVPAALLQNAMALARLGPKGGAPFSVLAALGSAAVLLFIITLFPFSKNQQVPFSSNQPTSAMPQKPASTTGADEAVSSSPMDLRGTEDEQSPFIFPVAGERVRTDHLVFRWIASDRAKSYEIELLTDSGTLLWSKRVSSLLVALPRNIHLIAGRTYYLKLSIHQKNGATQHTKAIGFVAG